MPGSRRSNTRRSRRPPGHNLIVFAGAALGGRDTGSGLAGGRVTHSVSRSVSRRITAGEARGQRPSLTRKPVVRLAVTVIVEPVAHLCRRDTVVPGAIVGAAPHADGPTDGRASFRRPGSAGEEPVRRPGAGVARDTPCIQTSESRSAVRRHLTRRDVGRRIERKVRAPHLTR